MDIDHSTKVPMEQMAISKFKATCLAVLERVRQTGKPIQVTRFGKPVAEVVPPSPPSRNDEWLGAMRGTGRIVGDLVAPATGIDDWQVER